MHERDDTDLPRQLTRERAVRDRSSRAAAPSIGEGDRPRDAAANARRAARSRALAAAVLVPLLSLLGAAGPGVARADGGGAAAHSRVLELFTSHGCSSCPRADRLLGELIEADPSLVALEFHVDYWNALVHGAAGNFVDPFSDADWTLRQRVYDALPLGGRPGVYTPQAIVDGRYAAVGSDAARIAGALAAAGEPGPDVRVERDGDALLVRVSGVSGGDGSGAGRLLPAPELGEIVLARFLKTRTTSITGGENNGRELVNHRIVTALEPLGRVDADGALTVRVGAPAASDEGCAVLVRHGDAVPRLVGTLCPDPG